MIEFSGVSKQYGGQVVLKDASFRIHRGERVGIIGPNGTGKSTIFGLMTGECEPDGGRVMVSDRLRLGYLRQELRPSEAELPLLEYAESGMPELHDLHDRIHELEHRFHAGDVQEAERERLLRELGELQTKFESGGGYELRTKTKVALGGLGFPADSFSRPLKEFSGGWQMRAELVRVVVPEPHALLLDEPSNYLDIPAIEWLQKFLRDYKGTLIIISHDRYLLNTLTTVTMEVYAGRVTRYESAYDHCVEARAKRREQELAAWENRERKLEKMEKFIDRFRAKNTWSSQVQSRVKMLEKLEEEHIEVTPPPPRAGKLRLRPAPHSGQEVMRLEGAGATYDGAKWVLRNVDLRIERGEKVALVGHNGLGKTTLLRIMAGQMQLSEGRRVVGHKVIPGWQSQDFADTMDPDLTVFDTVRSVTPGVTDGEVRTLLGGFGFSGNSIEKNVGILSGGEKVRLAFARLLGNPPNLLLLDEPTTHLDIAGREALEEALKGFNGTICLVSHDIEFVRRVATAIVCMVPPGVRRYLGGYDEYVAKRDAELVAEGAPAQGRRDAALSPAERRKQEKRERAALIQAWSQRRQKARQRMDRAEKRVEELEAEQHRLLGELRGGQAPAQGFEALNKRLQELQREISAAVTDWEAAADSMARQETEYRKAREAQGLEEGDG
jgi:ATP-binding cassette subfamily F protein 3